MYGEGVMFKFISKNALSVYRKNPKFAIKVYNKLPSSIRKIIKDGVDALTPLKEIKRLSVLHLMPLDSFGSEVIFAPFHDPDISPSIPIYVSAEDEANCHVNYSWCWTVLSWDKYKNPKTEVTLSLKCGIELNSFDKLLICLSMDERIAVNVGINQNNKWVKNNANFHGANGRQEIKIQLEKGTLDEIKLYFSSNVDFHRTVRVSWFGLQDSVMVNQLHGKKIVYNSDWPGLIKPSEEWGDVKFDIGLFFDENDIEILRKKRTCYGWDKNYKLLQEKANEYMSRHPEIDVGDYLPFNDTRYLREREFGKTPYYFEALVLAFVGLLDNDKSKINHSLRYLMCMIHTRYWTQSAESRLPGSSWDQRCFLEEMTTSSVSILADWLSFALTDRAKELIRQNIWDKGLSVIERDLMKYDYLYLINQGAVFCRARILGGLYLKKRWPRVNNLVERSFEDMMKCIKNYIEKDGATHEGPGYFCQFSQAVLHAIIAYSRYKKKDPGRLIKKIFANCDRYVEIMSGSSPCTMIPEGDCRTNFFGGDAIPILAKYFPGRAYGNILESCISTGNLFALTGTLSNSGGIIGFIYGPDNINKSQCVAPTFIKANKIGHLSSFRKNNNRSLLIHLTGSVPRPSHSHFDKGSIVVEFDGIPTFIDPGMIEYYFAGASELKRSYMHNVITPVSDNGVYLDQVFPQKAIIACGKGDEKSFYAKIDISNVWRKKMSRCFRSVRSDDVNFIEINDEGVFLEESALSFHLHSPFKFEIYDNKITINNGKSCFFIEATWAEEFFCRTEYIGLKHNSINSLEIRGVKSKYFNIKTSIKRIMD